MKYYANMWVNNGTRFQRDITDTNKRRLISSIYQSAKANRFPGNRASWSVYDENGHCVAAGSIEDWGSFRTPEEELRQCDYTGEELIRFKDSIL